MVGVELF